MAETIPTTPEGRYEADKQKLVELSLRLHEAQMKADQLNKHCGLLISSLRMFAERVQRYESGAAADKLVEESQQRGEYQ